MSELEYESANLCATGPDGSSRTPHRQPFPWPTDFGVRPPSPVTDSHRLQHQRHGDFYLNFAGAQTVTATAANGGGSGVQPHTINIGRYIYLPLVLRSYS
jgi:hypothetical protein